MIQNETQRKKQLNYKQTKKSSGYRSVEHNQESNMQFNWSPRRIKNKAEEIFDEIMAKLAKRNL